MVALWNRAPVAGVGLVLLSHALILYPALRGNAGWLGPVVTHFTTERPEVWLTIDDGPADDTDELLDLLERRGVRATFFVKGSLVARHPERALRIVERGHTIGNHTQTHPASSFWCAPPTRVAREIDDCNAAIAAVTGAPAQWFRAPAGMKSPAVHPALARRGMQLVGWSARGYDAVLTDVERIVSRVLRDLRPGGIILLHQGEPHSLRAIDRVIDAIESRGYGFVVPEDAALR